MTSLLTPPQRLFGVIPTSAAWRVDPARRDASGGPAHFQVRAIEGTRTRLTLQVSGDVDALRAELARQQSLRFASSGGGAAIVITGDDRAWQHFVATAGQHGDRRIRAFAVACLRELQDVAADAFANFVITRAEEPLGSRGQR